MEEVHDSIMAIPIFWLPVVPNAKEIYLLDEKAERDLDSMF